MRPNRLHSQTKPLCFCKLIFFIFAVLGVTDANAYPSPEYGLRRPSSALFFLDYDANLTVDRIAAFGGPSDVGLVGDVDGDTVSDFVLYRAGVWYIDYYNDIVVDRSLSFGGPISLDTPIMGDFNGDGKADIGVYRNNGLWYLDYNLDSVPDQISAFGGTAGDTPVIADFNGDGVTDRAIYRQGLWYVDFSFNATLDAIYGWGGAVNDIPYAADLSNDGIADLIVFRDGVWYVDFNHDGVPNIIRSFGAAGDRPVVGFFNPASSVFVRAGAGGAHNGTPQNPYATINAALAANPPSGTIIRIAVGNYPERVTISNKSNLTFQGAGQTATHLNPAAGDAFDSFLSTNITLRDLHIASQGPDGSTPGRGVANLGSSMTLERISTVGNRDHNVIGIQHLGTNATFTIDRSNLSQSQIGNGVELQGGITANITRSNVSGNGTDTANVPVTGGRAIVLTSNSIATVSFCTVNQNYDSAVLATNTANLNLNNNTINTNGRNGVFYDLQSSGMITGNDISFNGTRGAFGAGGYNGAETNLSSGFSITISGNTFTGNSANGVYADGGITNVLNNSFRDNFVGVTVANTRNVTTSATVKGNLLELSAGRPFSVGVFLFSNTGASLTITIGGGVAADKNTFRDYGSYPAIHCNPGSINATCPAGGNIFINSSLPVQFCTSCSP
jgi:hypothetical protein